MPTRLSVADRNAHANLAADALDASATLPGYVEIRSGSQPATVATAATGTLLATITLADPAYGDAATGTAALDVDPKPATTWVADYGPGVAWFRLFDGDGTARRDGTLGTVTAVIDDTVRLAAGSQVTMPESSA